jgi:hypothetical protein
VLRTETTTRAPPGVKPRAAGDATEAAAATTAATAAAAAVADARRTLAMVHGATPLFKKKVVTLCVPDSTRRSGVKQSVLFSVVHVVFSVVRVVFSVVQVVFGKFHDTYSAYPLSLVYSEVIVLVVLVLSEYCATRSTV